VVSRTRKGTIDWEAENEHNGLALPIVDGYDASCRRSIPFDEEHLLPLRESPENQNAMDLIDRYFYNVGQTTNCR
jgi:hypothetical protein